MQPFNDFFSTLFGDNFTKKLPVLLQKGAKLTPTLHSFMTFRCFNFFSCFIILLSPCSSCFAPLPCTSLLLLVFCYSFFVHRCCMVFRRSLMLPCSFAHLNTFLPLVVLLLLCGSIFNIFHK
jgi:hypothetical protein